MRFVYKVGIISVLCAFFLMSHNSYALDASINLNEYTPYIVDVGTNHFDYKFSSSTRNCINAYSCRFKYGSELKVAGTSSIYAVKKDDILVFQLYLYDNDWADWSLTNIVIRPIYTGTPSDVLYIHQVTNNTLTPTATGGIGGSNPGAVYEIAIKYREDGNFHLGIYNESGVFMVLNTNQSVTTEVGPYIAISGMTMYRYTGSSINKEQSEATQNAADESESEAEDNGSSQQTSNLIGVLSQFITALTALQPTNCNVTLPFPSSLGGSMIVNICQNKDKAGNIISVFGSLTMIVFYLPFSLKLLSMIYNEIRSFTNG